MKTVLFQGDSITDCGRNREDSNSLGCGYPLLAASLMNEKYANGEAMLLLMNAYLQQGTTDKAALMFHDERFKKSSFGTLSYMTSIFGLKCAEVVINDLLSQ